MFEDYHLLRYAFSRALEGDTDAIGVAAKLSDRGFKLGLFSEPEEVRVAAQSINLEAELRNQSTACDGCKVGRFCASNIIIDVRVEQKLLSDDLGARATFPVRYDEQPNCRRSTKSLDEFRTRSLQACAVHYVPESGSAW